MPRGKAGTPADPSTYEEQMLRTLRRQNTLRLIALLKADPSPRRASPQLRAACLISKHPGSFSAEVVTAARKVLRRYDLDARPGTELPNFMEEYTGIKASGPPVSDEVIANALGYFYVPLPTAAKAA